MIPSRGGLATAALLAARRSLPSSPRSLGLGLVAASHFRHFDQNVIRRPVSRVWESTTVNPDAAAVPPHVSEEGADRSGHIVTHSNESILFFDSMILPSIGLDIMG